MTSLTYSHLKKAKARSSRVDRRRRCLMVADVIMRGQKKIDLVIGRKTQEGLADFLRRSWYGEPLPDPEEPGNIVGEPQNP